MFCGLYLVIVHQSFSFQAKVLGTLCCSEKDNIENDRIKLRICISCSVYGLNLRNTLMVLRYDGDL